MNHAIANTAVRAAQNLCSGITVTDADYTPLPNRKMLEVTILVDAEDIDFSQCSCEEETESNAFRSDPTYTLDLCGAKYRGEDITFANDDTAEKHLINQRFGE